MFKIKYRYKTGNSFHTYIEKDILEFDFEDIKYAQESLQRIKEHYEWYYSKHNSFRNEKKKPKWLKKDLEYDQCINIRINEDTEIQFWTPWCGYFEKLLEAEIIVDNKISFE